MPKNVNASSANTRLTSARTPKPNRHLILPLPQAICCRICLPLIDEFQSPRKKDAGYSYCMEKLNNHITQNIIFTLIARSQLEPVVLLEIAVLLERVMEDEVQNENWSFYLDHFAYQVHAESDLKSLQEFFQKVKLQSQLHHQALPKKCLPTLQKDANIEFSEAVVTVTFFIYYLHELIQNCYQQTNNTLSV